MENNNNNNNNKGVTTSLEYKDHREFFESFLHYKRKAHELLSFCFTDDKKLTPAFQGIYLLVSYTSNYIEDVKEIKEKIKGIPNLINTNKLKAIEEMEEILDMVNNKHEDAELIPKKRTESKPSQDIWRKEEDIINREFKKAMADILMRNV